MNFAEAYDTALWIMPYDECRLYSRKNMKEYQISDGFVLELLRNRKRPRTELSAKGCDMIA